MKKKQSNLWVAVGAATLILTSPSDAESIRVKGKAEVTKDTNSVRALAETDARKNAIRALLVSVIGKERLTEVNDSVIAELADQIPSSNILSREGQVVKTGSEKFGVYELSIVVDVDGGWLTKIIDDQNIRIPSDQGPSANAQLMLVLDSYIGIASDGSKPQHELIEYSSQKGGSLSDTSSAAYSEKERAASSQSDKSAVSGRASSASGFSNGYGSAAGMARASGSSASSSRNSTAYSQSVDAASKTNVQAEVHDNVTFRKEVTYQGGIGKSGSADAAANALGSALRAYGVNTNPATAALNSFNVERFEQLQKGPWQEFLNFSASKGNNYIIGGKLVITNEGRDVSSQQYMCSGNISISGFSSASSSNEGFANGYQQATSNGQSEENCRDNISRTLAQLLAAEIGPQIQRNWRHKTRAMQDAATAQNRAANEGGEYSLIIRAPNIDFQTKRTVVEALNSLNTVQKPYVQVSQTQNEIVYRVTYKSADGQDLGMSLLGALVDRNTSYGASPIPTLVGQSVTLCLLKCQ